MKILITGGAGFIGSHLAEALLSNGDEIIILDDQDIMDLEKDLLEPDEEINPKIDLTPLSATKHQVDVALNNTFGFGGHTVTTLFRRYYK